MLRLTSLLLLFTPLYSQAQHFTEAIKVNQLGCYPKAKKLAFITAKNAPTDFYITTTNLRDTVYKGKLGIETKSKHSTTVTRVADFTPLTQSGSYVVLVPGVGHSHVFRIGTDLYNEIGAATLKAFYFQRASFPLDVRYAEKWHRSAGHPDTSVLIHASAVSAQRKEGTVISSSGGWYDAGDYNKYIVNSGITTSTLLSAYENFSSYYNQKKINIPESNNALPDILDEVLYNLRWMRTMQDPFDGGVYHKCTNANFDGMVMPGVTQAPRFAVQKSTAAALNFVAVMAQASRVLKPFAKLLPGLADSCLQSAKQAWQWAKNNPAIIYDQDANNKLFKPAIATGTYGDGRVDDEWFWASAEMYRTTGAQDYLTAVETLHQQQLILPTWNNVALLGVYAYLQSPYPIKQEYKDEWDLMQRTIYTLADQMVTYAQQSAFSCAMGWLTSDFVWGSNSNAANQGILLLHAYQMKGNKLYFQAALDNADYLLGRNATGYCFVTGFGGKSPMRPHHRPSVADGITEPVPGFLVGGPNPFRQDQCNYAFTETETAYTDDDCSYASNEIAINWNAPAVYLFNALEALKSHIK